MKKIMNNLKKIGLAGRGLPISRSATGVAVALVLLSGTAFATAIGTGEGNSAGSVLVSSSGIFFSNFATTPSPTCFTPGCKGSYLNATGTVQGSLAGAPTLTPNLVDWAEFSGTAAGLIKIDLNTLNAGFGTLAGCSSNAVGSLCTPTGSAITLSQATATSVSLFLSGNGIAYTGTSGSGSSPTVISFSSQNNAPGTITSILAAVLSANGFSNSVSATYNTTGPTTVPEPMTLSMMGLGLLGLGVIGRRRRKV